MPDTSELFDADRYPRLRKWGKSDRYGDMELLSVSETSDGFLLGHARVLVGEEGEHCHSVFLGRVTDFT